jgi:purine-binding chemotaxis protein CheW
MDADLHLLFAAGQVRYAVPSNVAAEVVNNPPLQTVPGSPAHVLGVFAHRGEVVPLIDLAQLFEGTPESGPRAVLARSGGNVVAFTARVVLGVERLSGKPAALADTGAKQYLKAPAKAPQGDVTVIEVEGLLGHLIQPE